MYELEDDLVNETEVLINMIRVGDNLNAYIQAGRIAALISKYKAQVKIRDVNRLLAAREIEDDDGYTLGDE